MLRTKLVSFRANPLGKIHVLFFNDFIDRFLFSGAPYEGIYWWKCSVFANIDTCPLTLFSQTQQRFYHLPYLY